MTPWAVVFKRHMSNRENTPTMNGQTKFAKAARVNEFETIVHGI